MSNSIPSIPPRLTVIIGHNRDCVEIARAILLERDVDIVIYQESLVPSFDEQNIPCRLLWDYLTPSQHKQLVMEGTTRAIELESFMAAAGAFDESLGREGVAHLAVRFAERAKYDFPNEAVTVAALHACASQSDVRLVIVPQDIARDMKTLTIAARRLGIPVLHQLHGFPCGSYNLIEDMFASHVAVYSESTADSYRAFGAENIAITGNPNWDSLLRPPEGSLRARGLHALNLDGTRPIIVVGLSYTYRLSEQGIRHLDYASEYLDVYLAALTPICREHPDVQVVIRPHPNWKDAVGQIEERLKNTEISHGIIDTKLPPDAALAIADLTICTESNFAIESLLQGVPSICVNIPRISGGIYEEGLGALIREGDSIRIVREEDALQSAIGTLLFDASAREELLANRATSLRRFTDTQLPDSTTRFAHYAASLIDENEAPEYPVYYAHETELIAEAIPAGTRTVRIIGESQQFREALGADITLCDRGQADCVVVDSPVPGDRRAHTILSQVEEAMADDGTLVFFAYHAKQQDAEEVFASGAWGVERPGYVRPDTLQGFSAAGIGVALSRVGLVAHDWRAIRNRTPIPESPTDMSDPSIVGWVIRAKRSTG